MSEKLKKTVLFFFFLISVLQHINAQVLIFESFEQTAFPPVGWIITNAGSGNNWLQNTTAAYASNGTKSMVYSFTSTAPAATWAFTPAIALDSADSVTITFDQRVGLFHLAEALRVTVGNAANVSAQTTVLYSNNNLTNTQYTQRTATFTASDSGIYYFAFNCHSAADRYKLYVDNIRIFKPITTDASLQSLTIPQTGCNLSPSEYLAVSIKNKGVDTIHNCIVSYSIDNGTAISDTITNAIAPNITLNHTFTTPVDFSATGSYSVKAYVTLTGDGDPYNDTLIQQTEHIANGPATKSNEQTVSIPDNSVAGIYSPITFCGLPTTLNGSTCAIDYLKIDSLNHPWISDINIYLVAPWGDRVLVSSGNGGFGYQNMRNVVFTDTATVNVSNQTNGIPTGYYHTEQANGFSTFNTNQNPNGTWRLQVSDTVAGDVGKLYKWTLSFKGLLSVADNVSSGKGMNVFPNPAKEILHITINKPLSKGQIRLIDCTGKIVYDYETTLQNAAFINIGQLQKGIYLLQVTGTNCLFMEKVVIE